jgi:hypothetical protein
VLAAGNDQQSPRLGAPVSNGARRIRWRSSATGACVAVTLFAACASESPQAQQRTLVFRGETAANWPAQCRPERVAQAIVSFFVDINTGAAAHANELFATEPSFQWLSDKVGIPPRQTDVAADRGTVSTYLDSRQAAHEQSSVTVVVTSLRRDLTGVDVLFDVHRSAIDIPAEGYATSKALLSCQTGLFEVFSLGSPDPDLVGARLDASIECAVDPNLKHIAVCIQSPTA